MKLRDIAIIGFAAGSILYSGFLFNKYTLNPKKPKQKIQATNLDNGSDLDKKVNDNLPEPKSELRAEPIKETLPTYKGYENEILKKYDNMIIDICNNFENKTNIKGIKAPPKDLVKKIILIETAYKGQPVDEFETDPGQTKKDNAYNFAVNGTDEGFYPENGFDFLNNSNLSDVEKTIWAEAIYLSHLASTYEQREITLSDEIKEYTIQSGDNIFDISQEFRKNGFETTQESIMKLNRIKNPKHIQPDKTIQIPNVEIVRTITSVDFSDQKALAIRYNGGGDINYGSKFDELEPVK